ncbi:MAG TPA: DUF4124 domain-containing protein [Gammaproteobacteria bacterium]|nr:DUF4124 domain-containing protein [Gammaproteobacteria bacterium]
MKYIACMLVMLAATAQAEVYKSINANGEVIYSDVPTQGAKQVEMPALPTYTPVPLPVAPPPAPAATQSVADAYNSFALTKPDADEAIRSNAGIVNVSVTLDPGLQVEAGHRIQFFLDGKPEGKPVARLSASFRNVSRGTHAIAAAVIDENGESLINAVPVTVHILRASIQQPNNPLNPANKPDTDDSSSNSSGGTTTGSSGTTTSGSSGTTSGTTSGSSTGSNGTGSAGSVSRPKGF